MRVSGTTWYIAREMNRAQRARRTAPLTVDEFAEYMAIKTTDRLSQMPPAERKTREAVFQKIIAEVRRSR